MNHLRPDFSKPKSLALPQLKARPRPKRSWTIPFRAVVPIAIAADALVILATGTLSGHYYYIAYLKTGRQSGTIRRRLRPWLRLNSLRFATARELYTLTDLLNFKSQIYRITIKWIIVFLFLTAVVFW